MFTPAEVAKNYVTAGKGKVNLPIPKMFLLAILAGVFIGIGGLSCTTVAHSIPLPSVAKFVGAATFPGGLTMVLIAGSELFTGNCLLTIPLLEKEIKFSGMIKNWVVVYAGNLVGSIVLAAVVVYSHQPSLFGGALSTSVLSTAVAKVSMPFADAFLKGIACNFLVCIAVWMSFAAKEAISKFIVIFFPIMIFVGCGFEHSVANMYFIAAGLFCKTNAAYASLAAEAGIDLSALNWGTYFTKNLIPVSLGNIVGGAICVGCAYWYIYLQKKKEA